MDGKFFRVKYHTQCTIFDVFATNVKFGIEMRNFLMYYNIIF